MRWRAGLGLIGLVLLSLIPGSAQNEPPQVYGGGTFSPNQRVSLEYNLAGGVSATISVLRIQNPEKVLEFGGPRDFRQTKD